MFSLTNPIEHLGHTYLLYPENFMPHPPKHLLTIGCRLIFMFDEIKVLPKGKPAFIFSKPGSLLICSKKPREESYECITI